MHGARTGHLRGAQNAWVEVILEHPEIRAKFLIPLALDHWGARRNTGTFQATVWRLAAASATALRKHFTLMLRWIITFLVVALIAGVFGFTGVAGAATDIARVLFYIFLVLLLVAIVASLFRGSPPAS